jgi:hypothetical protein
MLFGSSLSPVVCMSAYVLSVLFVLLCIVVSYMTCLYELHGKCVIRDRKTASLCWNGNWLYMTGTDCHSQSKHSRLLSPLTNMKHVNSFNLFQLPCATFDIIIGCSRSTLIFSKWKISLFSSPNEAIRYFQGLLQ